MEISLRSLEFSHSAFTRGFALEIPFPLVSKSNFRRYSRPTKGAWRTFAAFEESLRLLVRRVTPTGWENPGVDVPLAARPVLVVFLAARTTLDAGNISKSVLDALEGVLYANDAQVAHVASLTMRTRHDQRGCLAVAQVPPGSSSLDVLTAAHELSQQSWDWWTRLEPPLPSLSVATP